MNYSCLRNVAAFVLLAGAGTLGAQDWPNWQGADRTNISSEKGLLKSWPKEGPKKVWSLSGLGAGYSTVAVVGDTLYATGANGNQGSLFAISRDGKILWQKPYASEGGGGGYKGARSTPTFVDGKLYVISSPGTLCCHDAKTGEQLWKVDAVGTYGAQLPNWEMAESPLVYDGKVIVTVGGAKAVMVAFDAKTGKEVWTTPGTGAKSAYCSPTVIEDGKKKIILGMVESGLIGVDATNGKLLFQHAHKNKYAVHANTPTFDNGMIYITSGYDFGGGALTLSAGGVKEKWFSKDLATHHGGVVFMDGCIIGASDRGWAAIDLKSGNTLWKKPLVGKGSLTVADGMIYGYGENGNFGLIKADRSGGEVVSQFKITEGSKEHWAHPVVSGGRLYVRHGDVLMSFDVKQ